MLDEEDDHDFGENQNPITVQLHIGESIKDGDNIMLFLIDVNGFCQHASNGVWIRYNDLYGNPGVLKEGTWTRALPKLNKKSLSVNSFTSHKEEAKAITNRSILEKQEILYKILVSLRNVFMRRSVIHMLIYYQRLSLEHMA